MAQTTQLTCPKCKKTFPADIWLIVDGVARPELLDQVREGTMHTYICPHCETLSNVDAPLLLYLPDRDPPLLYSPARKTTSEQDQQEVAGLVKALRLRLGPEWQDAWVAKGVKGVPRSALPVALDGDPEAMAEAAVMPLLNALQTLFAAETWSAARQIVKQYAILLNDKVDSVLERLLEGATSENDASAKQVFEEHRALLLRCREIGVDAAFAEKIGAKKPQYLPREIPQQQTSEGMSQEERAAARKALEEIAALPPEQKAMLAQLINQAREAGANTPEALIAYLEAHPEFRQVLTTLAKKR